MSEPITATELADRLMAYVQGALARMAYGSAGCIEDMHVFELLRDQGMLQEPQTMEEEARRLLHSWFPSPGTRPKRQTVYCPEHGETQASCLRCHEVGVEGLGKVERELERASNHLEIAEGERAQLMDLIDGQEVQIAGYRQALKDVCSPMQAVLRNVPENERQHVNGVLLASLAQSVGFLQEIARKALGGLAPEEKTP